MFIPFVLWGAAGLACGLAAIRLVLLSSLRIRSDLLNPMVIRLCMNGDWTRVLKLCRALGESPYGTALGDVVKTLVGPDGKRQPQTPLLSLSTQFEEAFAERAKKLQETQFLTWLSAALVIGPAVQWFSVLRTMPHSEACMGLFAAGGILAAVGEALIGAIRRDGRAGGAALVPKLMEALEKKPPKAASPAATAVKSSAEKPTEASVDAAGMLLGTPQYSSPK